MITVSINKKWSTGEYTVTDSASKDTYYTNDPEDAVATTIAIVEDLQSKGKEAELSPAKYTRDIVDKYRPDWLLKAAKGSYELPIGLQKGRKGIYIAQEPESARSSMQLKVGEFPSVIYLGTKSLGSEKTAWLLGHELAHVKLGHGTRMGAKSQDVLKEETDAWKLAKKWNPHIPDEFIEKSLDTYRRIRGRKLTIARLRQHIKTLDSSQVVDYLNDVIEDQQTPNAIRTVAEGILIKRFG